MSQMDDLKRKRFQFLNLLYEKSGADILNSFNALELGKELGFGNDEVDKILQYLYTEKLINPYGYTIKITHLGIKEIESALSHPEQATHYFPPVSIINIQHMEGSQIQQGSVSSQQSSSFEINNAADIKTFIELLKEKLPELGLCAADDSEINADITAVERQISSTRPKGTILRECLGSIQRILEGAAGSVSAQVLIPYIPPLLEALGKQ